jgi:hypothetical protein
MEVNPLPQQLIGNPAIPRVIGNRSKDRLKPKVPGN